MKRWFRQAIGKSVFSAARGRLVRGRVMSKQDKEYFLARSAAEREAAERATSEEARRVHLQLAERYEEQMAGRGPKEPPFEEN